MDPQIIGSAVAGGLALCGMYYTNRESRKKVAETNARVAAEKDAVDDVERKRIEVEAFKRARESYDAAIDELKETAQRRDQQHASELKYLNERLTERNERIRELEEQLRETRRQVREIRESAEHMAGRLDIAERAIARNTRNAETAETRADVSERRADRSQTRADTAETRADVAEERADVSEGRADDAETQADTDRGGAT